jgi:hypothetical protein
VTFSLFQLPAIVHKAQAPDLPFFVGLAGRIDGRGGPGGQGEEGHVTPEPDTVLHHVRHKGALLLCPPFNL